MTITNPGQRKKPGSGSAMNTFTQTTNAVAMDLQKNAINTKLALLIHSKTHSAILAMILAAGIFQLDVFTGAHTAVGVLYVIPLAFMIGFDRKMIFAAASVIIALLLIDYRMFMGEPNHNNMLVNKLVNLACVILTVLGLMRYKQLQAKKRVKKDEYIRALEELLFQASKTVSKPAGNIQGLTLIMNADTSEEEKTWIISNIKASAEELNKYSRDLAEFVRAKNANASGFYN